jgi:hypothetical protein
VALLARVETVLFEFWTTNFLLILDPGALKILENSCEKPGVAK